MLWNMSSAIQRKDLDTYHEKIYPGLPQVGVNAMSDAFHSIGYMMVGYQERAEELFTRSYSDYLAKPFQV